MLITHPLNSIAIKLFHLESLTVVAEAHMNNNSCLKKMELEKQFPNTHLHGLMHFTKLRNLIFRIQANCSSMISLNNFSSRNLLIDSLHNCQSKMRIV